MLCSVRFWSFISRGLFIRNHGLCNPSCSQHPGIAVPCSHSHRLSVSHGGFWLWSLQGSALLLLFSSIISLHCPPRPLCFFRGELIKSTQNTLEPARKTWIPFAGSKFLPAGLVKPSSLSLLLSPSPGAGTPSRSQPQQHPWGCSASQPCQALLGSLPIPAQASSSN